MQTTKLGISRNLLGAIACLFCLFGGYTAALLAVGYIILFENDSWLKKTAFKALLITLAFSLVSSVIGLIPAVFGVVADFVGIFRVNFYPEFVYRLINFIEALLALIESCILILMAYKTYKEQNLQIGFVDKIIDGLFA